MKCNLKRQRMDREGDIFSEGRSDHWIQWTNPQPTAWTTSDHINVTDPT